MACYCKRNFFFIKFLLIIIKKIEKTQDSKTKDKKISVKFLGDNTTATVGADNICEFEEGVKKNYTASKKKSLINSILEAKKIYEKKEGKQIEISFNPDSKYLSSSINSKSININKKAIKRKTSHASSFVEEINQIDSISSEVVGLRRAGGKQKQKNKIEKIENINELNLNENDNESNIQEKQEKDNRRYSLLSNSIENKKKEKERQRDKSKNNSSKYNNNMYLTSNITLKSKRKKEQTGDFVESGSLLDKIINYLKYICKSLSPEIEKLEVDTLSMILNYLIKLKLDSPIEIINVSDSFLFISLLKLDFSIRNYSKILDY